MDTNSFIIIFVLLASYYFFFKKFKILNDDINSSNHKKLVTGFQIQPVLLGGIFLVTVFCIFSDYGFFPVKAAIILIFFLGLSSDKNLLTNPKIRLIIQTSILFFLIYSQDLRIDDLKIEILNNLLKNYYVSIIFTVFCFLVLVNGCNFIDGLNGLLIGYVVLVFLSLVYQSQNYPLNIYDNNFVYLLIYALFLLLIFNIFGLIFLGDSGSYILSGILGFYLLNIFVNNQIFSPYYIAALLWYPAFENLYSLIRRINFNKNVSSADNDHFHHLVYRYFVKKKIFSKKYINTFSSLMILTINLPSFIICNIFPTHTKILVGIIIYNISIYLFFYYLLSKYFKNKK